MSFTYRMGESTFVPGANANVGLNFDFGPRNTVMALEVGLAADLYMRRVRESLSK